MTGEGGGVLLYLGERERERRKMYEKREEGDKEIKLWFLVNCRPSSEKKNSFTGIKGLHIPDRVQNLLSKRFSGGKHVCQIS